MPIPKNVSQKKDDKITGKNIIRFLWALPKIKNQGNSVMK